MAWNEPGKNDNDDKNPWGRDNKPQQPPDLEEAIRRLQEKCIAWFGGGSSSSSGGSSSTAANTGGFAVAMVIALVLYALSGIYIVEPYEQAAVFQFGRYIKSVGPGPHWIPRFIRSKEVVAVSTIRKTAHRETMLNKDENIVQVALTVNYNIGSLHDYLFNVRRPEHTLDQVTDSAMRQIVGQSTLDDIMTSGRAQISGQIRDTIIGLLNEYKTGINITKVVMQEAKAPEQVRDAFDDAIRAQEDEQRLVNRAKAYKKRVVPIAEGRAKSMVAQAEGYSEKVVQNAFGDVEGFLEVLPEFQAAPRVTRERLYLEAVGNVLTRTSKILVDTKSNNSLMYLPLDKLMAESKKPSAHDNTHDAHQKHGQDTSSASSPQSQQPGQPVTRGSGHLNQDFRRSRNDIVR